MFIAVARRLGVKIEPVSLFVCLFVCLHIVYFMCTMEPIKFGCNSKVASRYYVCLRAHSFGTISLILIPV